MVGDLCWTQTQTSGHIADIVRDQQGSVIGGAGVVADNLSTADRRDSDSLHLLSDESRECLLLVAIGKHK
jgi:hypothetical protein